MQRPALRGAARRPLAAPCKVRGALDAHKALTDSDCSPATRPTLNPQRYLSAYRFAGTDPNVRMLLYGFKSCDTVRNAIKWLDANGIQYSFIDYRREPLDAATIDDWFSRAGWDRVFNSNAAAFRELSAETQAALSPTSARELILANTNLIKRPLLDTGTRILVGFNAKAWSAADLA